MEYRVVGDNQVLIVDGERKVGMIARNDMVWLYGTFNGDEKVPEHWVALCPTFTVGPNFRVNVIGVNKAIAEVKKFLR